MGECRGPRSHTRAGCDANPPCPLPQGASPMRGMKPSLALAALGVMGLALWASAFVDRTGADMATAADRFVVALDDGQRGKAVFPFESPERLNWHFIPRPRNGLPIKEMTS